jgi:hypothetical protein
MFSHEEKKRGLPLVWLAALHLPLTLSTVDVQSYSGTRFHFLASLLGKRQLQMSRFCRAPPWHAVALVCRLYQSVAMTGNFASIAPGLGPADNCLTAILD